MTTTMPFSSLRLGDQNPRRTSGLAPAIIRELALNIGFHGLLNALLVTKDGLVIGGQRRYRAIEFLIAWFSDHPLHVRVQAQEHGPFVEQFGESGADLSHIEFLIARFSDHPLHVRVQAQEHGPFVEQFGESGADLSHEDISNLERMTKELQAGVPVRVVSGTGLGGIALADNLQREGLSSFEIAQGLDHLSREGASGAELARLIGKSKAYVSRKLSAWHGAGPDLRAAWEAGTHADEVIEQIAAMPFDQQAKALAGAVPRGRRGPAARPPIEMVKDVLEDIARRAAPGQPILGAVVGSEPEREIYRVGVLDALRWVAGQRTSPEFAKLTEES